jgi:hypothetical protein
MSLEKKNQYKTAASPPKKKGEKVFHVAAGGDNYV